jgi:ribosomal protein S18 acetylase RimI-like enzyme
MWQITPATPADTTALSQVIAEAFHDLPPAWWLIPGPGRRREVFPGYFALLVEHALATGVVHTTCGRTAAALWLPVGAEGPGQPGDDYRARLAQVAGPDAIRFVAFDAELDDHHPTGTAHQYLAILAVRPDVQGQGIGTALLRTHHAALDAAGTAAYLEASSEHSHDWYQRHGYTDTGPPFHLPDSGPPLWPMWRPAAGPPPAPAPQERAIR